MHHFRGKLFRGDQVHLDPANVYIQYHATEGGPGQAWYGYLLVDSEADVERGGTYTLRLVDGRAGTLRVDAVSPDPTRKVRATFVGDDSLA